MTDSRLAWFAMGASFGAVLLGWPWHPRFSRYSRRGSNPPPSPDRKPPPPSAPPYSSAAIAWRDAEAQRIYRGAMWREKGSDVWHPLGEPIDFTELARQQLNRSTPPPISDQLPTVTVKGINWPATVGDFTLVGPADNQGACRWYERQSNGTTERIKVDHQLQPLVRTNPPPREP